MTCFGSNAPAGPRAARSSASPRAAASRRSRWSRAAAAPAATVAGLKAGFSLNKKTVIAGKLFTVNVKFNKAVTKSQVRVQIRNANTKFKGAIKKFKTIKSKLVTGTKAGIPVKIAKPGVYMLRVTYKNGTKTVNIKAVKVTVQAKRPVAPATSPPSGALARAEGPRVVSTTGGPSPSTAQCAGYLAAAARMAAVRAPLSERSSWTAPK